MNKLKCEWCRFSFRSTRGDARFCSVRCRKANSRSVTATHQEAVTYNLCAVHGVPLDDRGQCLQKGCTYLVEM